MLRFCPAHASTTTLGSNSGAAFRAACASSPGAGCSSTSAAVEAPLLSGLGRNSGLHGAGSAGLALPEPPYNDDGCAVVASARTKPTSAAPHMLVFII